ncbi:MAG: PDZ domain-containing protein [Planctomycetes bacterium]|nr:PDZ domain-containing protein [Planctomycetota bacterium]
MAWPKALFGALLVSALAGSPVLAQQQDEDQATRREIRERILHKVDERLQAEIHRIHEEIARLLDQELGLASPGKAGEKAKESEKGTEKDTAAAGGEAKRQAGRARLRELLQAAQEAMKGTEGRWSQAQEQFERVLQDAKETADKLAEGREPIEKMIAEARERTARDVADARATAEKLLAEARESARQAGGSGDELRKRLEEVRATVENRAAEARARAEKSVKDIRAAIEKRQQEAAAVAKAPAARKHDGDKKGGDRNGGQAATSHEDKGDKGHEGQAAAVDRPAWMGVQLGEAEEGDDDGDADADADAPKGATIARVFPETPAQKAGMKDGDVVTKIGKDAVTDVQTLIQLVSAHKAGDKIEVTVRRGDKEKKLTVTLATRPESIEESGDEPEDDDAADDENDAKGDAKKPAADEKKPQPAPEKPHAAAPEGNAPHDAVHQPGAGSIGFDDLKAGDRPHGFEAALTGKGEAGKWEVKADPTAPSAPNALYQTSTDETDYRFPLLVLQAHPFGDVAVTTKFKAIGGKVDQAAGIVFRYKDANNYYLARANALEDNVRLYKVVDGRRHQFAGANLKVSVGAWHELGIQAKGNEIEVSFDGKQLLTAKDSTYEKGLLGLWTKADSVTAFDDFAVKSLGAGAPTGAHAGAADAKAPTPTPTPVPQAGKGAAAAKDEDADDDDEADAGDAQADFDQALELHKAGKFADSVVAFQKIAWKQKDSALGVTALYNAACGYARMNKLDDAFAWLEKAIDHGFVRPDEIKADEDFESLRADARFKKLLTKAAELRAKRLNQDEDEDTDEPADK